MNIKKLTLLLIISCFSFSNNLTLKDFLLNIKQSDPAYSQIFLSAQNIEGAIQSLQAIYDPRFTGSLEYKNKEQQIYSSGGTSFPFTDIQTLVGSMGISKKMEDTGTNLSLTYLRVDSSSKFSTLNISQINPALSLRVTQPLLKDFMGVYTKIPLERLSIQKDIIALSIQEAEEKYFLDSINLYYDWLSLTLALEPLSISYQNATNMLEEIKEKYRNDAALKTDLLQAENAVLLYRNVLNETLYAWNALATNIYQKMGKEFTVVTNWKNLPQAPIICETFCKEEPPKDLKELRILTTLEKTLKQYELDLAKIDRENMPDLSVYGEISRYNYTDGSLYSFLDLNKTEYTAGAVFSTSLGQNNTQGQTKSILATIKTTQQELLKTKQTFNTIYKNNLLNLAYLLTIENNAQTIAENSRTILEMETKRFSQGKTTLFSISDFRQKYTQHKIDHLNKIVAIAKLRASIASINDSLLNKINELMGSK
jgi:outer membrane protein